MTRKMSVMVRLGLSCAMGDTTGLKLRGAAGLGLDLGVLRFGFCVTVPGRQHNEWRWWPALRSPVYVKRKKKD